MKIGENIICLMFGALIGLFAVQKPKMVFVKERVPVPNNFQITFSAPSKSDCWRCLTWEVNNINDSLVNLVVYSASGDTATYFKNNRWYFRDIQQTVKTLLQTNIRQSREYNELRDKHDRCNSSYADLTFSTP